MAEEEIREALIAIIGDSEPIENTLLDGSAARGYKDAGVLTNDEGLVLRTEDGSEFQITIVQSR